MSNQNTINSALNAIAESYVKLVLAVGNHDGDYVDAYYGPPELREESKAGKLPLEEISARATALIGRLSAIDVRSEEEIVRLRSQYLTRQLQSMVSRVAMLGGKTMSFDEEAKALYDADPPKYPDAHFESILKELGSLLPLGSTGSISERYDAFRNTFIIPREKLDTVFSAAITECRKRTKQHIELPDDEHFTVEYVTNKAWSGYNWYKGNSFSLIQVNTDLPIYIDRAVDLAAHEGYPGHHVYNSLLELRLYRERAWVEFTVYALFSPQSLVAEGTANFGIEVAFPGKERVEFEREALFPIAGFDRSKAEEYYAMHSLVTKLNYAHNEAARRYLDGKASRNEAAEFLTRYAMMSPERALQRTRFIDAYRSYVINYNLGQDLVKRYIETAGGTADRSAKRWEEFAKLLSSPRLPSGLR